MAITVSPIQHDKYLEIVVTGEFDLKESLDKFSLVLSACRLTGLTKVLIDFRECIGAPTATENIFYALGIHDQYEEYLSNGGKELQMAYLGTPPHDNTYEQGLKVVKNYDMQFDLFKDQDKALEWLNV